MADFRLVQVSDPHLSRQKAYFQENWEAFLAAMRADPPDLIVVTGDLCFDAIEQPDDMAFARAQMDRLPVPWLAIPGNHDVGDQWPDLKFKQPVDAAKRQRWLDHFGPDRWASDHGGWRLVGLNAMLFDSGLPEEAAQWTWLDTALEGRAGRDVVLFVHKPLYLDDPETTADSTLFYAAGTRRRLMDLAQRHGVRAIGSGHLHRRFVDAHQGVQLVWAPSSGFVMGGFPPRLPVGETEVGYVEYRLGAGVLSHHFVRPPAFALNDMSETMARLKSTVNLPPKPWVG